MSNEAELLPGTLDLLILKAVSLGPLHGYGVLLRIQQISRERLRIEQGSLYPALYRLEAQGWIASQWGESENKRRARFYRLTGTGKICFKSLTSVAHEFLRRLAMRSGLIVDGIRGYAG